MTYQVDLDLLADTAVGLHTINNELSSAADIPDWYDVGSDKVKDALSGFADEWKIHRDKLLENVGNAEGLVTTALDQYNLLDQQLTDALKAPAESGPSGGPP